MKLLLYSTGVDSELYRLLEKPQMLLFFTSGARYEKHEKKQLRHLQKIGVLKDEKIITDDTLNFSSIEQSNSIVPMRNIFYLLRAFEYAEKVLIGVTYYDLHYDKQVDVLNSLTSFVQNYYYFRDIPDSWDSVHPTILTPYRHLTKAGLLRECLKKGINVDHIPTLRSCYSATSKKGCGRCKSCVQKAVMLANNGMFHPLLFDEDPRVVGKEWIKFYKRECVGTIDPKIFKEEVYALLHA